MSTLSPHTKPKRGCRYILRLSLVAFAGFLFAYNCIFPAFIAYQLVYKRSPVCCASPQDWGLDYQSASFTTRDGLILSGWYLPSRNGAAIIVVHGSNGNRTGGLNHAAMLADHGYGVLLFDLRGHGDSEGERFTWGWDANLDIDAALAYLFEQPDVDPQRIGALGLSMGGEVVLRSAAQASDIRAVISEGAGFSTFADYLAIPDAAKWLSAPFIWTQFVAHGIFAQVASPAPLIELIAQIAPRPVFLIYGSAGSIGEVKLTQVYYALAGEPKTIWQIPESGHVGGLSTHPDEYESRIIDFLDQALLAER